MHRYSPDHSTGVLQVDLLAQRPVPSYRARVGGVGRNDGVQRRGGVRGVAVDVLLLGEVLLLRGDVHQQVAVLAQVAVVHGCGFVVAGVGVAGAAVEEGVVAGRRRVAGLVVPDRVVSLPGKRYCLRQGSTKNYHSGITKMRTVRISLVILKKSNFMYVSAQLGPQPMH